MSCDEAIALECPVRFEPIIKRAIWGGTRLGEVLGKPIGDISDAAESWELSGLPGNESIVSAGPFCGRSIQDLVRDHGQDLLGRHAGCSQFPLLVKLIDAQQQLSVQVHPGPDNCGTDGRSKAEAWIVLAAGPESRMYLGLRPGVDEPTLREAAATGQFGDCLHTYHPRPGDCIYLPPGTVHALGGDLLIAEIQQPSNTTYRLHDWNRVDSEGRPRELHIEEGLRVTNFHLGPVLPTPPTPLESSPLSEHLVSTDYFIIHRHRGPGAITIPDDDRMHVLMMVQGEGQIEGSPDGKLSLGQTVICPARRDSLRVTLNEHAVLLDAFLPDDFTLV